MASTKISQLPTTTALAANDLVILDQYAAGPVYTTKSITGQNLKSAFGITPDGGFAILVTAGEALSRGHCVCIKQTGGVDGRVFKTPTTGNENDMPVGVAYADAALAAPVWIVVSGIAYVLPEAGVTAARGYVMLTSTTTAGLVTQLAASGGATATHFREIGHFLDTGSGAGVITRAVLHFN